MTDPILAMLPEDLAYRAEVLTNRSVLGLLEELTEELVGRGETDSALLVSSAAVCWAVENHPGIYDSGRLESALARISAMILGPSSVDPSGPVVHLLTRAFRTGGHTRLTWRWIMADTDHEHLVVLTDQAEEPVPEQLLTAARGRVVVLASGAASDAVREVHRHLAGAAFVVMNVAEHDTVALTACADASRRPPSLMVNQADHRFFLGAGFADGLLNLRPSAVGTSSRRRGVSGDRNLTFPIPIDDVDRVRSGGAAKVHAGLPEDSVVLLTMASSRKFAGAPAGKGFCDLVSRILSERPSCHLVAIGPAPQETVWATLARQHPGRVHVLGVLEDPQMWLETTDIYLDPFPLSSGTSLLEAVQLGAVPVALGDGGSALGYDAFGAEILRAPDHDAWISTVLDLVDDPDRREDLVRPISSRVRDVHGSGGLAQRISDTYAAVTAGSAVVCPPLLSRCDREDRELVDLYDGCHPAGSAELHLAQHLADRGLRLDGLAQVPAPTPQDPQCAMVALLADADDLGPALVRCLVLLDWQPDLEVLLVDATGEVGPYMPAVDPRITVGVVADPDQPRGRIWADAAARCSRPRALFTTTEAIPGPRLMAALQLRTCGEPAGVPGFLAQGGPTMVVTAVSDVAESLPGEVIKWL
jgi:glycosyltransferase involved in cell wall biosynthesis